MLKMSIAIITASLFLSNCAFWPHEGEGGQAESFPTDTSFLENRRINHYNQLECYDRLIQNLHFTSAATQHPAQLASLSVIWTRAIRAHAAYMTDETQADLRDLSIGLDVLKSQMEERQKGTLHHITKASKTHLQKNAATDQSTYFNQGGTCQ